MFDKLSVEIFGESHSPNIGGTIKGLPIGYKIDVRELKRFLARRSSLEFFTTPRHDSDEFEISGLDCGLTSEEIKVVIQNENVKSSDYDKIKVVPRPSHADYPCFVKYGKIPSGGGRYSGRMTAPLTVLGGIAKQILKQKGIEVEAKVFSIGGIENTFSEEMENQNSLCEDILKRLKDAKEKGDSLGGIVECKVTGLPIGLGDCLFEGLEGKIAANVFAIPAVKGVEFGRGFKLADMTGSEANDAFKVAGGKVHITTNNMGGINGGMTNGNPVEFKAAFHPTPTIGISQDSVNLSTMQNEKLKAVGRHDVCFVTRAVVVVEAVAALAILDEILKESVWKN